MYKGKIDNGKFIFNPVTKEHLDYLLSIRNSPIRKWFFDNRTISAKKQMEWYKTYSKSSDLLFVVEDSSNIIGTVGVKDYYLDDELVEFGQFCINTIHQHKGYATLILSSLFSSLFRRHSVISCRVLANNNRALQCYLKLGFIICGFVKGYQPYVGRVVDVVELRLEKRQFLC